MCETCRSTFLSTVREPAVSIIGSAHVLSCDWLGRKRVILDKFADVLSPLSSAFSPAQAACRVKAQQGEQTGPFSFRRPRWPILMCFLPFFLLNATDHEGLLSQLDTASSQVDRLSQSSNSSFLGFG